VAFFLLLLGLNMFLVFKFECILELIHLRNFISI